jgi:hypothetical protein
VLVLSVVAIGHLFSYLFDVEDFLEAHQRNVRNSVEITVVGGAHVVYC